MGQPRWFNLNQTNVELWARGVRGVKVRAYGWDFPHSKVPPP